MQTSWPPLRFDPLRLGLASKFNIWSNSCEISHSGEGLKPSLHKVSELESVAQLSPPPPPLRSPSPLSQCSRPQSSIARSAGANFRRPRQVSSSASQTRPLRQCRFRCRCLCRCCRAAAARPVGCKARFGRLGAKGAGGFPMQAALRSAGGLTRFAPIVLIAAALATIGERAQSAPTKRSAPKCGHLRHSHCISPLMMHSAHRQPNGTVCLKPAILYCTCCFQPIECSSNHRASKAIQAH